MSALSQLSFKEVRLMKMKDQVAEILEKEQKPLAIKEIFFKMRERGYRVSLYKLRMVLLANKEVFRYLKYTKAFSLSEWETKDASMRHGTIRYMIYEYLKQFDEPKSIQEIFDHVRKYRYTQLKSIKANIRMLTKDRNDLFEMYDDNKVGLRQKSNSAFILLEI